MTTSTTKHNTAKKKACNKTNNDDIPHVGKTILSFDVGIKNLAYCMIKKTSGDSFEILSWDVIDLSQDYQKCMFTIRGGKLCGQPAKFAMRHKDGINVFDKYIDKNNDNNNIITDALCTCATHKDKISPTIIECKSANKCAHPKCKSAISHTISVCPDITGWCDIHYEKCGAAFLKKITTRKITKVNCNKQPIQNIAETMFAILDSTPDFLTVDEVLIENQPSLRNPTMKTIMSMLYSYFAIRGITDKLKTMSNISAIKFVCPSNKLKINKNNTDSVLKKDDLKSRDVYVMTKSLGKKYCEALISQDDKEVLYTHKKKDDMCDAFLQAFQYIFSPVPDNFMQLLYATDDESTKVAAKSTKKATVKVLKVVKVAAVKTTKKAVAKVPKKAVAKVPTEATTKAPIKVPIKATTKVPIKVTTKVTTKAPIKATTSESDTTSAITQTDTSSDIAPPKKINKKIRK